MGDQGRWFKLWTTAPDDPHLGTLPIADFGRWCKFGAYLKVHGKNGMITLYRPTHGLRNVLQAHFQMESFDDVITCIRTFPNCVVTELAGASFQVKWLNWAKYQSEPGRASPRTNGSESEEKFAALLRSLGRTFQRNQRFPFKRTFYTVDFFLPDLKLAFEIQGPEHSTHKYRELDRRKSGHLMTSYSVLVIPIDNTSILTNPDFTTRYVIECIESRTAASSPLKTKKRRDKEEKREEEKTSSPPSPPPSSPPAWGTVEALIDLYNSATPNECPEVERLTPGRREKARRYLAAFPDRAFWESVFREIHDSKFLRGLVKREGHTTFLADFDWLLTKGRDGTENAAKVAEGKFHD